jgi:uncharacterized membrane protein YhaH (DUF805 family)
MPRGRRCNWSLKASLALLAQSALAQSTADDAAALGACAACSGIAVLIPIAILALNIALLVWVAKDAKSRGMDNAVVWMVLVMVTSLIGLVIYILSRPKGELVQCASCGNSKLQSAAKCPHCGNA